MNLTNLYGLPTDGAKAFYLLEELYSKGKNCLCLLNTYEDIEIFSDNLNAIGVYLKNKPSIVLLPEDSDKRIPALQTLLLAKESFPPLFILTDITSIALNTIPKNDFRTLEVKSGNTYNRDSIIDFLAGTGYSRSDYTDDVGTFSVRGEILDAWSPQNSLPCRIVFSDNEIESIKLFETESQRSREILTKCLILPAQQYNTQASLYDYIPPGTTVFIDDNIKDENIPEWVFKFDILKAGGIPGSEGINLGFFSNPPFKGNLELLSEQLAKFREQNYSVTIFCNNIGEQERLLDLENKVIEALPVHIGKLNEGFHNPELKTAYISYNDIFGRYARTVRIPKFKLGSSIKGLWEISAGAYVVHEKYGIGKYMGLKQITIGDNTSEYLSLEYRGGDKLYVPVSDFHKVQKYIGVEGKRPRLYSLDMVAWEHAKERAKKSAGDLAKKLHDLYNSRKRMPGYAFIEDSEFEKVLTDSFSYEESPDQLRAISEVKQDMQKPYPMDRLVLGDVGFGKTEVAIRSAFKAVLSSKQVAVLVPTTVLAEQHYNVFKERLKSFPVNIAILSRFQTKKEQKTAIDSLKKGMVDIIIGTHRLIQKDIHFKDLGLLIIDEEHRFGVKQKEYIKIMKNTVDTLSLTATPIPRTLSISMSGIKDLSLIESAPEGRLPIETHITQFNEDILKKAVYDEINRKGQVFFIHNYIYSITGRKNYLQKLMPDVKFEILHGRMHAKEIEKTMWEFSHGKIDCLIATTIIEAGLDLPNVNTMIIENAEEFGLSQLYQLRGRIGRSRIKAYCYMFFSEGSLTEDAKKRLQALYEFMYLGSGFKLALRDMEIRGAGEILGQKQHGFVADIGLDLYCRYIQDEISVLKGSPQEVKIEKIPAIDLNISAYIPDNYIEQDDVRITYYRRFMSIQNNEEIPEVLEELKDRFGKIPDPVKNLVDVVELRLLSQKLDIKQIKEEKNTLKMSFYDPGLPENRTNYLLKNHRDIIEFSPDGFKIKKSLLPQETTISFLKGFLEKLVGVSEN